MTASGLHSQKIDTAGKIWIPRQDALKKLEQAKEAKVLREYTELLKKDTFLLSSRIRELSMAITYQSLIIESYKKDSATNFLLREEMDKKYLLASSEISKWQKAWKKEKTKRKITGIAGIIVSISAIVLPIIFK